MSAFFHHASFQVKPGKLSLIKSFVTLPCINWSQKGDLLSWDTGKTLFFAGSNGWPILQFCEESDNKPGEPTDAQHFGLMVEDVQQAVCQIVAWADSQEMCAKPDWVNEGKCLLMIPELMYCAIELVPRQNPLFTMLNRLRNIS